MMFMDEHILAAAQAAHEANRTYCQSLGDNSQVPWAEAPEWQKTHPCLVPYSELPDAQRFKDDLFRNNIRKVLGVSE